MKSLYQSLFDLWTLTHDIDAADLLLHGFRVDLTHVAAAIALLHLPDLQLPYSVTWEKNIIKNHFLTRSCIPIFFVIHGDPRVVCDDPFVECQNRLVLCLQPTDLLGQIIRLGDVVCVSRSSNYTSIIMALFHFEKKWADIFNKRGRKQRQKNSVSIT